MFEKIQNPREIRLRLNLNQQEFWGQIGVTQSGGSRYESGRNMPKPVRELLRLVHVDQVDLKKINRVDVALISYLKAAQPALYRKLKTEASTRSPARKRARR
jgi:transcriptional regulator with XRE-family HTH domain